MTGITGQAWFWPALAIVIGLPILLLVLTELYNLLARRQSSYAKPVLLLRNYVLPACALFILLDQVEDANLEGSWARIAATVFGFLVMLFLLSGANAVLFGEAREGSWRKRLPTIFIDLGRLVLIVVGIGVLLSWVWGADIGGLVTAVGVTSIVIGLAVQTAVGPVIAGLLMLFEQPFAIGDWLDTDDAKGRVVEVNWRSVHIDTGNGIQIIPNATLATGSFTNLSRVTGAAFRATATVGFSADDPPGIVTRTLLAVADSLPAKVPTLPASVTSLGEAKYKVSVPVSSPADEGPARNLLLHRAWYAAQRASLHLDGAECEPHTHTDYVADALRSVAATLGLGDDAVSTMSTRARRLAYAEGETIQQADSVPDAIGFITEGTVALVVYADDGMELTIGHLGTGDYIGTTTLTRQQVVSGVVATSDAVIVSVSRDAITDVVRANPRLARSLGAAIEMRRAAASAALAEANRGIR
ncbi:membrane protein [Mycobacterium antarcticum]|uniref:mechanosensitive ion channel family protein n=1 Tax=unclassified Mycolicibacterium TaxID=2636767 RepID=UPI0023962515|nr:MULTISPECIES: mechanosensitive ion channel family protein [unclassified Mycolicibacterium]BDX34754.1 membrane protein [Mycolicibacterium sp. TUM20985]GLP77956.1 membrane protein [Mycolicibacterium sp. TUM20983]GLP81642.1 membrane protein [Mycolicibacterium sp. TUM20984]